MILTVSGEIGAGKSTVARALAHALGLRYLSSGAIFREEARRRGVTVAALGRLAEQDPSIDRVIDQAQVAEARAGDIVVESRLSGWLVDGDVRIWLRAPAEVRARRVAARDGMPIDAARADVDNREACERRRYAALYQIDLADLSRYHLILDTSLWGPEDITHAIATLSRALRPPVVSG
ncbi:MAG TPA: AAA family ATPase [bacterium]|nr:AAA family ATPase [bacterium]